MNVAWNHERIRNATSAPDQSIGAERPSGQRPLSAEKYTAASLTVALAAVWSTKCSVTRADMNVDCRSDDDVLSSLMRQAGQVGVDILSSSFLSNENYEIDKVHRKKRILVAVD